MLRARLAAAISLAAVCGIVTASVQAASRPLLTGFYPTAEGDPTEDAGVLNRIHLAGARFVRVDLPWNEVAPSVRPSSFRPDDPGDPAYNWTGFDDRVRRIHAAGLEPVVSIVLAPSWAERGPPLSGFPGTGNPDPNQLGEFAKAAALRYSGSFGGLPRVSYWAVWNEPNLSIFFYPQLTSSGPVSPDWYREATSAVASAVHGVHSDNIVIAGETAPFRDITPAAIQIDQDWGPLKFMQHFLCVDESGRPTCSQQATFDVWSTHPYTSGGPTHHAALPYDVSLGDLPKMRATLDAAIRLHHIVSSQPVQFWATEFSWDSKPPDPCSPPVTLLKRWVPEAMYRMWSNGIDEVTWFLLMDLPMNVSYFQSGLYWYAPTVAAAKPKPYLEGFRFPFVALRRGTAVTVWAHTPFGARGIVAVEQKIGTRRWKLIRKLSTDRFGIVQATIKARPAGLFRASLPSGEKSLPFSMRVPADHFYNPFGLPSLLEPNGQSCTP